ncbi:hypothetical protein OF83DRAFT_1180481 [Amylostereum chailletii]|nr:hypothetical protein OF83DRAFT_1180481 [Amylostereum chailletii]
MSTLGCTGDGDKPTHQRSFASAHKHVLCCALRGMDTAALERIKQMDSRDEPAGTRASRTVRVRVQDRPYSHFDGTPPHTALRLVPPQLLRRRASPPSRVLGDAPALRLSSLLVRGRGLPLRTRSHDAARSPPLPRAHGQNTIALAHVRHAPSPLSW